MLVSDFDYELPPERIAQEPALDRSGSRLLHLRRGNGVWQDRQFREFPDLLRADDVLVLNNTRVFAARLFGRRRAERAHAVSPHNIGAKGFLRGTIEVLLTRQVSETPNEWECLVRPGRKIGVGERLYFGHLDFGAVLGRADGYSPELEAEVVERGEFGERRIRFAPVPDFLARVERVGTVPLPPYIKRDIERRAEGVDSPARDRERYQTVYAQASGSVAAPTAGLHFTPEVLERIRARGIEVVEITLHVGLGTFQPVRVEKVEDHRMHSEHYEIRPEAAEAINRGKREKRRIVAVGTTTLRTLEYAARDGDGVSVGTGEADLFIYPGYRFRAVDALLTNFHLPQSTLLMLVCGLGGKELVMGAYGHAIKTGYRFYSYGDCMLVE
jgi:S-adenosylmethionine:tRNA ribosyltransferase-isomerase